MRNRHLHQTLRAFAEEAALQLAAEPPRAPRSRSSSPSRRGPRGAVLLPAATDEFIRSRLGVLGRLPSYPSAAQRARALRRAGRPTCACAGERRIPTRPRDRADAALRLFLSACSPSATEFEFSAERFERAYARARGALYHGPHAAHDDRRRAARARAGVRRGAIGEGLALVRGDALDDVPDDARGWAPARRPPNVLRRAAADGGTGDPLPVTERARALPPPARARCGCSTRRLRARPRGVDAGRRRRRGGWSRSAASGARAATTCASPPSRRTSCAPSSTSSRAARPARARVAWALSRFELGCERAVAVRGAHRLPARPARAARARGPASGRMLRAAGRDLRGARGARRGWPSASRTRSRSSAR